MKQKWRQYIYDLEENKLTFRSFKAFVFQMFYYAWEQ